MSFVLAMHPSMPVSYNPYQQEGDLKIYHEYAYLPKRVYVDFEWKWIWLRHYITIYKYTYMLTISSVKRYDWCLSSTIVTK